MALDELAEQGRDLLRGLGEDRLALGALEGQAGIRDAVNGQRRVLSEVADRVPHVLGPGRAVEPDHVHLECREGRQDRGDVRPEQHLAALREQRDRGLNRQRAAGPGERLAGAEDRRLDLEEVLRRLDDDQVGAALDQPERLLGEDLDQLAERDRAQGRIVGRRQVAGRPDRAGDEPALARGLAGDLRRAAIDLGGLVGEPPLVELQPRALEGVRLDDLRAGLQHRDVDPLDDVGPVEHERLVALTGQPAVVVAGELDLLQRRTHAAVENDHALAYGCEEVSVWIGGQWSHLHRSRLSHHALLRGVRWLRRLLWSGSLGRSGWSAKDSGAPRLSSRSPVPTAAGREPPRARAGACPAS